MKDSIYRNLERFVDVLIARRGPIVVSVLLVSALMLAFASQINVKTVFTDLLPDGHEYIEVNERFKETFGGSNIVSIMLEVDEGDVFRLPVLEKLKYVTEALRTVQAVDPFQINSLASRKAKEVRASTDGIENRPVMYPELPADEGELTQLRESVLQNPLLFGVVVSTDLKAALVTVDFYDHLIHYPTVFKQISEIAEAVRGDGVRVRVVGEPILYGWVDHFLGETMTILAITVLALAILLCLINRSWYGTFLPLLAGLVSGAWALFFARLFGFHLDPLIIVVAFLITGRAISNSVQLITRFDAELARGAPSAGVAARESFLNLFKPSVLAIVSDAGCVLVVYLTPIPLIQSIAVIGTIWISTLLIAVLVTMPPLLSWQRTDRTPIHPVNLMAWIDGVLGFAVRVVTSRGRVGLIGVVAVIFAGSGIYALGLKVGDENPGSPILWPHSSYNIDAAAVNSKFQGADRMFVVFAADEYGGVKDPQILGAMDGLQRYMAAQPEIGGSLSLADMLPQVKRVLREGNPRYQELGRDEIENGELLHFFISGTDPGDTTRFVDPEGRNASVTFFFRDHKGDTIRIAMARVKQFIADNPLPNAAILPAGGLIGVLAAANEVILAGQIEAIALGLLVVVLCCAVTYRSLSAGIFFMIPVMLANTLTFSYMTWKGIGMNINTLPVVALGIGLGVDYTFYIVDGIREELHKGRMSLEQAVRHALYNAGRGVLITAVTLVVGVLLWTMSSLRLQAEMGLLIAVWLSIAAACSLFVMPALVCVFRPRFIVGHLQT